MSTTTWRAELLGALAAHGETFEDIEATTLTDDDLDVRFDDGYGATEGKPFTAWTKRRVYFPTSYDGAEGVDSVSRHPDGEPTLHIGGG